MGASVAAQSAATDRRMPYVAVHDPVYQAMLQRHGIVCSMSRQGECHDNAVAESFFASVTKELEDRFPSYGDAKMAVFDYIECSTTVSSPFK